MQQWRENERSQHHAEGPNKANDVNKARHNECNARTEEAHAESDQNSVFWRMFQIDHDELSLDDFSAWDEKYRRCHGQHQRHRNSYHCRNP